MRAVIALLLLAGCDRVLGLTEHELPDAGTEPTGSYNDNNTKIGRGRCDNFELCRP